jgi:hypothetical protein
MIGGALFPVSMGTAWKTVNRAEAVCPGLCGLYRAFLGPLVHGKPRIAIAPILIRNLPAVERVVEFRREIGRALKASLFAASAYTLLFALRERPSGG